jgi:FlaA1/EpsC-like NDP-sugar epimerase
MLKQNSRLISRLERLGDNLLIIAAFFAAYYGRDSLVFWNDILDLSLPFEGKLTLAPVKDYFIVLVVALIAYALSLNLMGAYGSMRLSSVWRLFRVSFVSSAFVFVVLAASLFILKIDISRSFVALFVLLSGCGLALERYLMLSKCYYLRSGRAGCSSSARDRCST